ncbi:MAG: hypothetical protein WC899_08025 [bacterium]|jgi:hyaluronan synthase
MRTSDPHSFHLKNADERSERSWDFLFGICYGYFSFFALFWIFPFAALTLRSRSWMTR